MYAKYKVKDNEIVWGKKNKVFNNLSGEAVKILLFAEIFKTKSPKALKKFIAENHLAGERDGLHKVISLSHL